MGGGSRSVDEMHRIMIFRLGSRDVHLPKLFGAFIMLAATLMLLQSLTTMFSSWGDVKEIHACLDAANAGTTTIQTCQTQAYYAFDLLLHANQLRLTDLQIASGLLPSIAMVFFWVAVLIVGMVFYRSWKIMIPIEENVINVKNHAKWRKKR